jgi:integral membrane protein (TIGR01906 family)
LFVIALPVLMITSAIRFATNEVEVYYYSISTFDAEDETGVTESELRRASRELVSYFNSDDPAINIQVGAGGQTEPLFSPREIRHLQDVKSIMDAVFLAQEAALAYVLIYVVSVFVWSAEAPMRALASQALTACLITVGFLAIAGALAISGFDSTWEGFHQVLFTNDLWELDPDRDRLIQMFPEEFWFRVVMFIGGLVLLQVALVAALALAYNGVARRRETRRLAALHA